MLFKWGCISVLIAVIGGLFYLKSSIAHKNVEENQKYIQSKSIISSQSVNDAKNALISLGFEIFLTPKHVSNTMVQLMDNCCSSSYLKNLIAFKKVIIHVWGIFCPPCRREMPELNRAVKDFRQSNIPVICLCLTSPVEEIKAYLQNNALDDISIALDGDSFIRQFNVSSVPQTFLLKDGKIIAKVQGIFEWSQDNINYIKEVLK
jgi:thiol-disulfide isomerase/thioredoxin